MCIPEFLKANQNLRKIFPRLQNESAKIPSPGKSRQSRSARKTGCYAGLVRGTFACYNFSIVYKRRNGL